MSAIKLRKFGIMLARLPDDRTTWAQWSHGLGEEIDAIKPFLTKKGTAQSIILKDTNDLPIHYRVVIHAKDDIVGVDDDTGERKTLTLEQIQLYSIDWNRVVKGLREGLNLSGSHGAVADLSRSWEVGCYALSDERSVSVYFLAETRDQMRKTLDRFLARGAKECLVIVADTAAIHPDVQMHLRSQKIHLTSIADKFAVDDRLRLIGFAGIEGVLGDLRALLGLGSVHQAPFQFSRNGARWDIVFRCQEISVCGSHGMAAIARLLEKPNTPVSAVTIQSDLHHIEQSTMHGSQGPILDQQGKKEIFARMKDISDRMKRLGEDHPEYDRLESELDHLLAHYKQGDGLGGKDIQVTTAARAGRAIGNAINRAIETIKCEGETGIVLAEHLMDAIKGRSGQNPCYKPGDPAPLWVVAY